MATTERKGTMSALVVAYNSVAIPRGGDESKGFGRLSGDGTTVEHCGDDESEIPPPTAEQLRIQRYRSMLLRAGFEPDNHLEHLEHVQKKEGADSVKLGAVSGQLYKDIFNSRAFDQYFFQIPPKKSALEMMSDVARKILMKDPAAEDQRRKDEAEAKIGGGGRYGGTVSQRDLKEEARLHRIGFKKQLFGPSGLAPPQKDILNSDGREKFFSYDGDWVDGQMHGFGTYRFADGATYEGVMRNNWPEGEGTARYSNGGVYVGRWKAGKCEEAHREVIIIGITACTEVAEMALSAPPAKPKTGFGRLTYATGTVYEGGWHEGRRSGKGKLTYKSGSHYEGDFILGKFHGRGRFESANLKVVYEGWWDSGCISGHGSLTLPNSQKVVRSWPKQNRYGGGLSLRGAMELVQHEKEQARLDKLDEKQELHGVADLAELQFQVRNIRREIAENRAAEKAYDRAEIIAKRKAAKIALMEAKMKTFLEEEQEEEPDSIEKEFML